jgi:hypothetical protein
MKAPTISLTLAAMVAAFGAGCANTSAPPPAYSRYPDSRYPGDPRPNDPNQTARGAVAGAVAGAVIGGIIGNNSEHGNTEKGAAIGAVAGGLAGAAIGNRVDKREAAGYRSQDVAYTVQSVPQPPNSEPRDDRPERPSPDAVWVRGYYEYTGRGYQWQPGRWEISPPGSRDWIQPAWYPAANGGYDYVRGHWQ